MVELEEGLVFHGCEDAREKFQRRNFKITELIERRSSYSSDQVEYEDLETGETSTVSQNHIRGRLESGSYREGCFENCDRCRPGDTG